MLSSLERITIEYIASDGEPMAETGIHVTLIAYFLTMLRTFFRHRDDVYVGGNMFMYYQEDEPTKKVAPDLFIVFGVPNHERRIWKVWEEGKSPNVIFEFTSRGTWDEDLGTKKGLYAWMGVEEYFLFDPVEEYLTPRLQGFRLADGSYAPIQPGEESGALLSHQLGLALRVIEGQLQLFRRDNDERLLPPVELASALSDAQQRLRAEIATRQAAEAENEQLRAELARLKKERGD